MAWAHTPRGGRPWNWTVRLDPPEDVPSEADIYDLPKEIDDWVWENCETGGHVKTCRPVAGKFWRWEVEVDLGDELNPGYPGPIADLAVWEDGTIMTREDADKELAQ